MKAMESNSIPQEKNTNVRKEWEYPVQTRNSSQKSEAALANTWSLEIFIRYIPCYISLEFTLKDLDSQNHHCICRFCDVRIHKERKCHRQFVKINFLYPKLI